MNELIKHIEQWSIDKGIDKANPRDQYMKVAEEFGEIGAALSRSDTHELKDAIGDTVITLIILAQQHGWTIEECLKQAYDVIKGRTGKMINGVFVKSEDL